MGRYSLALRPRWQNPAYDNIGNAITQAATAYEHNQDADREEQNKLTAMGATEVPDNRPGAMDRLRGIGGAIGRTLHIGGQPTPDVHPIDAGQPDASKLDAPYVPPQPGPGGMPGVQVTGSRPDRIQNDLSPQGAANPNRQGQGGGISDALGKVIYHGRGGRDYSYDPNFQRKQEFALHEQEADAADRRATAREVGTETRKLATQRSSQDEAIRDAVAAGMPEAEARLRVRNGLLRFDQDYGQQQRGSANALTYDQKAELQRRDLEARQHRAEVMADRNSSQEDIRRAQLAVDQARLAIEAADRNARVHDNNARAADAQVPNDPVARAVAEMQPGGAQKIVTAESTAKAERESAGVVRARGSETADSTMRAGNLPPRTRPDDSQAGRRPPAGAPAARGKTFTPEQTRTRASEVAKAHAGKPWETYDILTAEGYTVNPPKTPRP